MEEAATAVIAAEQARGTPQPWTRPSFIDAIAALQRDRQLRAAHQPTQWQFHDRSVVCSAALAVYLGYPVSPLLTSELERIQRDAIDENRVFFIRHLGFITPTEARRLSRDEALRFEAVHERTYREFGFELISIEPGTLAERAGTIMAAVRASAPTVGPDEAAHRAG